VSTPRDDGYLLDIREAGAAIGRALVGVSRRQFGEGEVLQAAVCHWLQIIGEASNSLSEGFRGAHPEIPWRRIIGLRNVIVHQYSDVDPGRVWRIARTSVPALLVAIGPLLPEDDGSD